MALAHGVFAGTDSSRPWMFAIYVVTGLVVLFLLIVRGLSYGYRPPRPERNELPRPSAVPSASSPIQVDGSDEPTRGREPVSVPQRP